jgi:Phage integrase family
MPTATQTTNVGSRTLATGARLERRCPTITLCRDAENAFHGAALRPECPPIRQAFHPPWTKRSPTRIPSRSGELPPLVREIDVAPELANAVKRYSAGQGFKKSTYLFRTSRGEPLSQRNVLRDSLHPILKKIGKEKCGFHIFRRFRASWLRKNRVSWDLEKMWMGHAHKDLTDQYAEQLREDVKYRREWCEKIGLGFSLPTNVSQRSQPKRGTVASRKAA